MLTVNFAKLKTFWVGLFQIEVVIHWEDHSDWKGDSDLRSAWNWGVIEIWGSNWDWGVIHIEGWLILRDDSDLMGWFVCFETKNCLVWREIWLWLTVSVDTHHIQICTASSVVGVTCLFAPKQYSLKSSKMTVEIDPNESQDEDVRKYRNSNPWSEWDIFIHGFNDAKIPMNC